MVLRLAAALLAVSLGVSCTPSGSGRAETPRSIPQGWDEAALSLLEAMAEPDLAVLTEFVPRKLAKKMVRATRLSRRQAAISDIEIEAGELEMDGSQLEPGSTGPLVGEVPYSVTWRSEAVEDEVPLEGQLQVTHSAEDETADGEWTVAFDRSLLWPGIEAGRAVNAISKWGRRGKILDRDGRVLAKGRAEARTYPQGSLAGTTIGHIEPWSVAAGEEGILGMEGDLIGGSGLEGSFQEHLGGAPTIRLAVVDRKGKPLEELGLATGKPGRDLRTTLDIDIQRAAEKAYGTTGGAVVLAPKSGDILAAVSSSSFSPGSYVGAVDVNPFNRALSGLYPPGSAMKVVTAAAALETGVVKPNSTLTGPGEYKGVRNFESGVFGSIPFSDAVRFSVNTAFAQVAEDLGPKRITKFAEAFGFNREPAMELQVGTSSFPEPQGLSDLMWGSIGQAQVLASPLQMASVAATIANEGKRMEPRIDLDEPKRGERVVSVKTARSLALLMEGAVQSGTGVNAQISGLRIAGKTGTAEVDVDGERKNHAWFVCFAPVGKANVALSVVSEYGGVGGQVAAPIARAILSGVLPHLRS